MKRFISFSGGVESTTMCLLYGKGATALFCDTGAEPEQMYERINYCEGRLKEIHEGDFELVRIRASVTAKGKKVDNLIDYILQYAYMPSPSKRFCTKEFKVLPIDRFLKKAGECELLIGFNADEDNRVGNAEMIETINYRYPLIEDGLTRNDCEGALKANDLLPSLPFWMNRGGCWMCFYQNISQLKAQYFFDRTTFDRIKRLEEDVNAKMNDRKYFYPLFIGIGTSVRQIEIDCELESALWSEEEIKKMYYQKQEIKPCGAFCHR